MAAEPQEGFPAIAGSRDQKTFTFQERAAKLAVGVIIFDDENGEISQHADTG
jgi:hypothetical protein